MEFKKFRPNLSIILLTIYLTFVWCAYLCVNITNDLGLLIPYTLMAAVVSFFFSALLVRTLECRGAAAHEQATGRGAWKTFVVIALVTYLVMLFWQIAYYPGAFSADSLNQYTQAVTNIYDDWHPVWHTLLFFWLPLAITGNAAGIIVFQHILFSLTVGYIGMLLGKYCSRRAAMLAMAYILLNPLTGIIVLYPWKDTAFAIAGALCMAMTFQIHVSRGAWAERTWFLVLLGFALTNATLFRHNAILFTAPLLVALFFTLKKRQWNKVFLGFLIPLFLIQGPLYSALKVQEPGSRVLETTGFPLTVLANVVKEATWQESMDSETVAFVNTMTLEPSVWEEYECGSFNSIKWSNKLDLSPVEDVGYGWMLRMMLQCFRKFPGESLQAAFAMTDVVYGIELAQEDRIPLEIVHNDYGIRYAGNQTCFTIVYQYSDFMLSSVFKYFQSYGTALFAMLCAMLAGMRWRDGKSWKKLLLCLPIFCYDFGTMFLLSGPDTRLFFLTFLVCPLIIGMSRMRSEAAQAGEAARGSLQDKKADAPKKETESEF